MSNAKYDSEFCGSLPIQLINQIQAYGVLVVLDETTWEIVQVSENARAVFGKPVNELVGKNMSEFLPVPEVALAKGRHQEKGVDKLPLTWTISGRSYLTVVHARDRFLLCEIDLAPFEAREQNSFVSVYQEIKYAMSLVESASSIHDVAFVAARELKRISGFDKVMIYRFDKEWNGTVIAEELEDGMESYMGFTFPASDVPKSARDLYLRNPYRFIPTREYEAVKLFPVINPLSKTFLDLSECNLRAVPAVHLEYLKNMGVTASMSTRILFNGNLWGLIACHHRTSKRMSYEMLSVFEMISNILSSRIAGLHNNELHALDTRLREDYKSIIEEAYRQDNLEEALFSDHRDILALFNAQGAAISRRGRISTKGQVPSTDEIRELLLWLHTRELRTVYHTAELPGQYESNSSLRDYASGLLVIPIDSQNDEYLLLFRPEVVKVINWGGNPNERIQFDADQKNYHPRNSFRQWQEHVEGTSMPWSDGELTVAENLRSFIYEFNN